MRLSGGMWDRREVAANTDVNRLALLLLLYSAAPSTKQASKNRPEVLRNIMGIDSPVKGLAGTEDEELDGRAWIYLGCPGGTYPRS